MLSKSELKFLTEGGTGNPDYDRVMKHRIRAKLLKFERDVPVLKRNDWSRRWLLQVLSSVTENCNGATEFRNAGENENSPNNAPSVRKVAPGRGFEPLRPKGPQVLQTCALPG